MPRDDPTELFDVCDESGRLLGVAKPRALVHRDGDWHRSLHIWVVVDGGEVVLQRRALSKDSHPGKVDVSVAGHLRAGEGVEDALREAEEEIGLVVQMRDLVRLGVRRHVGVGPGRIDREIQEVFVVTTERSLSSLRPDPDEVAALLTVPLTEALALVTGEKDEVAARELDKDGDTREVVLRRDELLLDSDGYFAVALRAILEGGEHARGGGFIGREAASE
jgi:isopentenyldiphosphate isomerase